MVNSTRGASASPSRNLSSLANRPSVVRQGVGAGSADAWPTFGELSIGFAQWKSVEDDVTIKRS